MSRKRARPDPPSPPPAGRPSVAVYAGIAIIALLSMVAGYRWLAQPGTPSTSDAAPAGAPAESPQLPSASGPPPGASAPPGQAPVGMRWIPSGEFTMGTDDIRSMPNEHPAHRVEVQGFWLDEHAVTNADFERFIDATGYVTTAERKPDWEVLKKEVPPGTPKPDDSLLVPGALVFTPPPGPVPLDNLAGWWTWTPGASWKHPGGPRSTLQGLDDHPVVQIQLGRCRGVREVGGEAAADRSGMGICRPGRTERHALLLGQRIQAERPVHGQHVRQAIFRTTARPRTDTPPPRPWGRFPPTGTGSTTWPATSGSGRPTGTGRMRSSSAPARASAATR